MKSIALTKCLLNACTYSKPLTAKIRVEITKNLNKKTPNNFDHFQSVRQFSTTHSNKSGIIPPLLWLVVKPLTKLSALIAGRYLLDG
jgi:hypothetical protein